MITILATALVLSLVVNLILVTKVRGLNDRVDDLFVAWHDAEIEKDFFEQQLDIALLGEEDDD